MFYFKILLALQILTIFIYLVIATTELIYTYHRRKRKGWKNVWQWKVYKINSDGFIFLFLVPLVLSIPVTFIGYVFNIADAIINYLNKI